MTCQENCPYDGKIPYRLTSEGLNEYGINEKYANMIFTYECPLYQQKKLMAKRSQRVQRVLGPLSVHSLNNFDSAANPVAFDLVKKYVSKKAWQQGGWLIIYGKYGTGKTHLLSAIIHEAIMGGTLATFANLAKISTLDFGEAKSQLSQLADYDLVGIDDFGIESTQNWLMPNIFRLFDDLNEGNKGLVITTNLPIDEFEKLLGERIKDRLVQHAVVVAMKGTSKRMDLRNVSWAD
ncbi:MAG: ATP-binding protein [Candidatus Parvarchaeota archaeon]|nr:ATP-binding protein [Candidatus Jingweiarchaeum tengchongense]